MVGSGLQPFRDEAVLGVNAEHLQATWSRVDVGVRLVRRHDRNLPRLRFADGLADDESSPPRLNDKEFGVGMTMRRRPSLRRRVDETEGNRPAVAAACEPVRPFPTDQIGRRALIPSIPSCSPVAFPLRQATPYRAAARGGTACRRPQKHRRGPRPCRMSSAPN
jgi:hypothetical protein